MFTKLIVCMSLLIGTSTAQFDVYYAYPEQLYQAQTQNQLQTQLHQLQQPLKEQPQPETGLYLMASQPNSQNNMFMNNQIGPQDSYNYQPANPTNYFQNTPNQNIYQNQPNQNFYQSPMNPNPPNLLPGEYVVCGNNIFPNSNCVNPMPSTTLPPVFASPLTDCTYSGIAATTTTDSDEEDTKTSPTKTTTTTYLPTTLTNTEVPSHSADTNKKGKGVNTSIAPLKNIPDQKTQYFLHEKKRKIKVNSPQNKMFVRKLVNESSKGKVLVPYRNTMSMINHAKDS